MHLLLKKPKQHSLCPSCYPFSSPIHTPISHHKKPPQFLQALQCSAIDSGTVPAGMEVLHTTCKERAVRDRLHKSPQ